MTTAKELIEQYLTERFLRVGARYEVVRDIWGYIKERHVKIASGSILTLVKDQPTTDKVFFKKQGERNHIVTSHSSVNDLKPLGLTMTETSTFIIDETLDTADVFDDQSTSVNDAYQKALSLTKTLRDMRDSGSPRLIDSRARIICLNPGPYHIESDSNFQGVLNGNNVVYNLGSHAGSQSAEDLADIFNDHSGFSDQFVASSVKIKNRDYLMFVSEVVGATSAFGYVPFPDTISQVILGIAPNSSPYYQSEAAVYEGLLTDTTEISGLEDNPLSLANQLTSKLRVLSGMLSNYKQIHQLDRLEDSLGVNLDYLLRPDEALNSIFD